LRNPINLDVYPEMKAKQVFITIMTKVKKDACADVKLNESCRYFLPMVVWKSMYMP